MTTAQLKIGDKVTIIKKNTNRQEYYISCITGITSILDTPPRINIIRAGERRFYNSGWSDCGNWFIDEILVKPYITSVTDDLHAAIPTIAYMPDDFDLTAEYLLFHDDGRKTVGVPYENHMPKLSVTHYFPINRIKIP